jgi:hypothetical protein
MYDETKYTLVDVRNNDAVVSVHDTEKAGAAAFDAFYPDFPLRACGALITPAQAKMLNKLLSRTSCN